MAHQRPSKWIPGRYPAPGHSPIADAIRQRRGERGITALDAALLHVPPVAEGWNTLLGAVRTKGVLRGDLRELMILRVAAINGAAYEWIHHEPVGRQHKLTTAQLFVIRDIGTPLPPAQGLLSPLQTATLVFADASTQTVRVPTKITETLREELKNWVLRENSGLTADELRNQVDDLFVEAALVVSSYNMVSRFLVAVDVAGSSEDAVPWPLERKEHLVSIPLTSPTHTIHAVTLKSEESSPWIVFANSLLTDLTLWSLVVPYFLSKSYNVLLLSQRGHGQSTLPAADSIISATGPRVVTIPLLASDIHDVLKCLTIPTPVETVIGVSQGGATALAYAALYGEAGTKSIIVCDTSPRTPAGNREAWEERIKLVGGEQSGMPKLAAATVPRWFPPGSKLSPHTQGHNEKRAQWITNLIVDTNVNGFEAGARALGDYDATALGVLESGVENVLLVAGNLDGGGAVGTNLQRFGIEWNSQREYQGRKFVEYVEIEGSGHLPMVDEPESFWRAVSKHLSQI